MANPLRKGIALPDQLDVIDPFSSPPVKATRPNDYRVEIPRLDNGQPYEYNRQFCVFDSTTRALRVFVDWAKVQPNQPSPADHGGSWEQIRQSPVLRALDQRLAAMNYDSAHYGGMYGITIIVCVYSRVPGWANGTPVPYTQSGCAWRDSATCNPANPLNDPGKGPDYKFPTAVDTLSPYAYFVSHLLTRYSPGAAVNPGGPQMDGVRFGNPEGAWVNLIECWNEPNRQNWPLDSAACIAATMMQTSEAYSSFWQTQAPAGVTVPGILGPATADVIEDELDGGSDPHAKFRDYRTFTDQVLTNLSGWTPTKYVGWSHHNYRDVELGLNGARAKDVIQKLYAKNWKGAGADRWLWLTEGGTNLKKMLNDNPAWRGLDPYDPSIYTTIRNLQAARLQANFDSMKATPEVVLWMQWLIHDSPANSAFQSALRDNWISPPNRPLGAERPAYDTYRNFPTTI
jgi:hypothetical protein